MGRSFKHLTYKDRKQIDKMRKEGKGAQYIASELGVCRQTIYNEIERGSIEGIYNADIGHRKYEKRQAGKGRSPIILTMKGLPQFISDKILREGKSPKQIEQELRQRQDKGLGTVGYQTIYSAIRKGYIPGVTMETLHNNLATVQGDASIYIPKWFIEKYGLKQGQRFEIFFEEDRIVLMKAQES